MKDKDTPLKLVRKWPKMLPACYEMLDYLKDAKSDGEIWWPEYCMLPIGAAFTYLVNEVDSFETAAQIAAELTACWIWRKNKIVYRFDEALMESLCEQTEDISDTEKLPIDLLLHLPYPCIYIKCPGFLEHIDGFFVWVEWDVNRKAPELRVQMVFESLDHSIPMVLHLIPGGTVGESIEDTIKTTKEVSGEEFSEEEGGFTAILSAMQMVLYIVADNADIIDEPDPVKPLRTSEKVVHLIQDKAGEVKAKDVGFRVGAALRKARVQQREPFDGTGMGNRIRSHTRRGHWHHYWTGPMDGERTLILKWTAPTVIHPEEGIDDAVVIIPVKE